MSLAIPKPDWLGPLVSNLFSPAPSRRVYCRTIHFNAAGPTACRSISHSFEYPVINDTLSSKSSPSGNLQYTKYNSCGKDFLVVQSEDSRVDETTAEAAALCLNEGVEVIIVVRVEETEYLMKLISSGDTSLRECVDAVPCLAIYIYDGSSPLSRAIRPTSLTVSTPNGSFHAEVLNDEEVRVNVGEPNFDPCPFREGCRCVNKSKLYRPIQLPDHPERILAWTVIHILLENGYYGVTFGSDPRRGDLLVDDLESEQIGPLFERVFPDRKSTAFVQVVSRDYLKLCVWKHGTDNRHANMKAAAAALVIAVFYRLVERDCTIEISGVPYRGEWSAGTNFVRMTVQAIRA